MRLGNDRPHRTVVSLNVAGRGRTSPIKVAITMIVALCGRADRPTRWSRSVTERMRAELGQIIVAENVGGAGRQHRARPPRSARRPTATTSMSATGSAHVNQRRDIFAAPMTSRPDFEPIALLALAPQIVVAGARPCRLTDCGPDRLDEGQPADKTTLRHTAGAGSPPHVGGVLLQSMTRRAGTVHLLSRATRSRCRISGGGSESERGGVSDPTPATAAGALRQHQSVCGSRRRRGMPDIAGWCRTSARSGPAGL